MEFAFPPHRRTPTRRFAAAAGGAALEHNTLCGCGDPVISLHLIGDSSGLGLPRADELDVLLPQCIAPELFGAVLAFIRVHEGAAVADAFVKTMLDASEEASKVIAAARAQGRGCCDAAYRTGGREHTCRKGRRGPDASEKG
ncbi:hypothetical protein ABZ723_15690 [Streptomyces sp. NPDC006700]|uniref:hypothetical protein n=1 Tax=unclassified Streptomyces TaxID=2593676 RepID=UPI0033D9C094